MSKVILSNEHFTVRELSVCECDYISSLVDGDSTITVLFAVVAHERETILRFITALLRTQIVWLEEKPTKKRVENNLMIIQYVT